MNYSKILYLFAILAFSSVTLCHNKEEWKSRTIYQIITDRFARTDGSTNGCNDLKNYCGGTFRGIINNLDYVQGMGFDAIWISPVVKNSPGRYHGYAAIDFYTINPEFGTEDEFKELSQELHNRNMWLMVDIVANHVSDSYPIENIKPFNKASNYHPACDVVQNDWDNLVWDHLYNCKLENLPDLNYQDTDTKQMLLDWIKWLVQTFGIDGLRIDTVLYMPPEFWTEFTASAGVFQTGEVNDGRVDVLAKFQGSVDSVLDFPMYYTLINVFQTNSSMYELSNRIKEEQGKQSSLQNRLLKDNNLNSFDMTVNGLFVENHDVPRFLCDHDNKTGFKSALTYSLFGTGIPIIYYGGEQFFNGCNDPYDRAPLWTSMNNQSEGYKWMQTIVNARKQAEPWKYPQQEKWVDDKVYVFTRGRTLVALSTNVSGPETRQVPNTGFDEGELVCNIFYG